MESVTFSTRTTSDLLELAQNKLGLLGWNYSKNKIEEVSLRKKLATKNLIILLKKTVEDEHILEEINQQSRKRPCSSGDILEQAIKIAKIDFDEVTGNEEAYVPQGDASQEPAAEYDWNQSAEDLYKKDMEDFNNREVQIEIAPLMDDDPIFADLGFLFEDN
ncbi:hypothetical protein CAEBREN_11441 [Caenorhabditis brenneri]|uniref:Uncharacterized protein n=1 Tax=Caenorhabditis brenneri TaxID=135651 RepID=G0MDA6_CAEBE|nr:hypothetical protein CAEBREN_11441 [Caenorhabditis brenneri]